MSWPVLQPAVLSALGRGLAGAAVLSPRGAVLAVQGALEPDEVRAIAAFVSSARRADFLDRLFAGELVTAEVAERQICLGVAGRCVFVLTVLGEHPHAGLHATDLFRRDVTDLLARARDAELADWIPTGSGSSGSGAPPAETFVFPPDPRGRSGGKN